MMKTGVFTLGRKVFWWQQGISLLSFLRSILLMRLILPNDFGTFALALTLGSYISIVRAFDFRTSFISQKDIPPSYLSTQFTMEMGLCGLNLLVSCLIAPLLLKTYDITTVFIVLCMVLADGIDGAYSTPLYLTERNVEFSFISRIRTLVSLTMFVISLGLAYGGWGVWVLVVDRVVTSILMGCFLWIHQQQLKLSWKIHRKHLKEILSMGSILFLCGILGKFLFAFDQFIIGTYWGHEILGFYSRAMKWALLPMEIGTGFLSMLGLALYAQHHRQNDSSSFEAYQEMTFFIARISIWMAGMIAILFQDYVPFLFGSEWEGLAPYFWVLIPYTVARPLLQNTMQCLLARHQQGQVFQTLLGLTFLFVGTVFYFKLKGPLWIGWIASITILIGYLMFERNLYAVFKRHVLRTLIRPVGILTLALLVSLGITHAAHLKTHSFLLHTALAIGFTFAAWTETRQSQKKLMRGSPTLRPPVCASVGKEPPPQPQPWH